MRNPARPQDRFPRTQCRPAVVNLKQHLTLHHVEPLFLMEMEVPWRTALHQVLVFNHEQAAIGLAWHRLKQNRAVSQRVRLPKPVLSRFHRMDSARWRKRGTLAEGESLEPCRWKTCCWKHECCALEQITTLHWQSPLLQRGMNQPRGEIPLLHPGNLHSGESA